MASTSSQPIQWSDMPVKNAINTHLASASEGISSGEELMGALATAGAILKSSGDEDKFQAVRQATQRLLEARNQLYVHHNALSELHRQYHNTGETTDFKVALEKEATLFEETNQYISANDPLLAQFDRDAGAAGPEDEQIDDDIAIEGGSSNQLARNTQCPITMKPILELQQPVCDHMNFVYEKAGIESILRSQRAGPVKCPVAGTMHTIQLSDLRPALQVIQAQKKAARAGGKKRRQEEDDADVLELA